MIKKLLVTSIFLLLRSSFACDGYVPLNDLNIPVNENKGILESQYHEAIDLVEKIYAPIAKDYGAKLKMDRLWSDGTVNAGTFRDEGDAHWHVRLYGGLPRHKDITQDAFILVMCHEIGHHIGGAPKKTVHRRKHWSSTEGQADYWGTLKCLRRLFEDDDNQAIVENLSIPEELSSACEKYYSSVKERALCLRIGMAAIAASNFKADVRGLPNPQIQTPVLTTVEQTFQNHPIPQCRLDTYFQGLICQEPWKNPVSQTDEVQGTCHEQNGHSSGMRPLCWFKPQI